VARVLDLEIELLSVTPRVWRRVRVPATFTLADLHHVIQIVMDWRDYHLHLFEVGGREYGQPPEEEWEREHWEGVDDSSIKLVRAFAEPGAPIEYVYDFGDEWRLAISLQSDKVVGGQPPVECLEGDLAGPPEDSGGPGAYQDLIATWGRMGRRGLAKELREWLPPDFDPMRFDRAAVNLRLQASTAEKGPDEDETPEFADADEQMIADVTLLALYLGSWEEASGRQTAWKTLRFEVLDVLKRQGLIETTPARKSVIITEAGVRRATALRKKLAGLSGPPPDEGQPSMGRAGHRSRTGRR
jgi:hypothetical protein